MRSAMVRNTSANSRDSFTVSSISSLVMRVHLAQIRTFSSVGSSRTAFSYAQFFLEQRNNLRPPSVMLAVTQLLYHMSRIFQDNSVPPAVPTGQQVDRKLRRKIQEKKIAMGHKPDDHEEQWPEMTM